MFAVIICSDERSSQKVVHLKAFFGTDFIKFGYLHNIQSDTDSIWGHITHMQQGHQHNVKTYRFPRTLMIMRL